MAASAESEYLSKWITQVRKGLLDFCVMRLLDRGERYGYQLVQELKQMPNLVITEGTIYPILAKLKKEGLLISELKDTGSGPTRRYYRLSPSGEQMCDEMGRYWQDLTESVKEL
ncbi:MAG: PadR family transcriptional regulator [Acidobacteria bacterium]|nr:PadR family transcriptional regulator [Acidobacteriota bacterium]